MLTPWDKLTPEAKKLYIRQVEVFAAYVAYNDHEIGRVIQAFEDLGKLDNTLIIYRTATTAPAPKAGRKARSAKWRFSTASAYRWTCR
ncbi:MAG: sulfatase-like hydrolase/transferase [Candidatus Accumulibacter sp. UW25]